MPKTLPSLLRAYEISARAAAVGFDWARPADVVDKIEEEVAEVRREVESGATGDLSRAEEEMGDMLFAIANLSRKLGIEPEAALRRANEKFTRRFDAVEQAFAARAVCSRMRRWRRWRTSGSGSNGCRDHEGHEEHEKQAGDEAQTGRAVAGGCYRCCMWPWGSRRSTVTIIGR